MTIIYHFYLNADKRSNEIYFISVCRSGLYLVLNLALIVVVTHCKVNASVTYFIPVAMDFDLKAKMSRRPAYPNDFGVHYIGFRLISQAIEEHQDLPSAYPDSRSAQPNMRSHTFHPRLVPKSWFRKWPTVQRVVLEVA